MEKLKSKKTITIILTLIIFFLIVTTYIFMKSQNQNEKYFDIILAGLYNEEVEDFDNKLSFLSNIDDPDISFFSDLKIASISNLEKYQKIDKDLILLKRAIIDQDQQMLKNLSLDEGFIFNSIAEIFFLNYDLTNYSITSSKNNEIVENFFLKAVSRYSNEVN